MQPDYLLSDHSRGTAEATVRMAASRDLPKMSSSCTTVVIAR